jgi:hypothetical protein
METRKNYFLRKRDGRWEVFILVAPLRHPYQTQNPIFAGEIEQCWKFIRFKELGLGMQTRLRLARAH